MKDVSVTLKDTYDGATTDENGFFSFQSSEKGNQTIVFSNPKYVEIEKTITINAENIIVNSDLNAMREIGVDIPNLLNIKDIQQRRVKFCNYIKTEDKNRFDVQSLERIVQLERIQNLQNLQYLHKKQITIKYNLCRLLFIYEKKPK